MNSTVMTTRDTHSLPDTIRTIDRRKHRTIGERSLSSLRKILAGSI
jgi:hypothetical protein